MVSELKDILGNVNVWLNFAEMKNGALLAFEVALLAAVGSMDFLDNQLKVFSCICILICMIPLVFSFIPVLYNYVKKGKNDLQDEKDTVIFYADIAKYEWEDYLKLFYLRMKNEDKKIQDIPMLEQEYAREIVVNSRITLAKYRFFAFGVKLLLIAMLACGSMMIIA